MKGFRFSQNVTVRIKHGEFGTELKCNPGEAGQLTGRSRTEEQSDEGLEIHSIL